MLVPSLENGLHQQSSVKSSPNKTCRSSKLIRRISLQCLVLALVLGVIRTNAIYFTIIILKANILQLITQCSCQSEDLSSRCTVSIQLQMRLKCERSVKETYAFRKVQPYKLVHNLFLMFILFVLFSMPDFKDNRSFRLNCRLWNDFNFFPFIIFCYQLFSPKY